MPAHTPRSLSRSRFEDAGVAFFDGLKLEPENETLKRAVRSAVAQGRTAHQATLKA